LVVEGNKETVDIVRGKKRRRLHKAFFCHHHPNNGPLLHEALKTMRRADLVGNNKGEFPDKERLKPPL
jgi:hypothetical protein